MLLLLLSTSWAQGLDADVELVRLSAAPGSMPGIDSPDPSRSGAVRVGLGTMYVLDPVVLYADGAALGPIVHQRLSNQLAVELGVADFMALRASLPLYAQWGGASPTWSNDGAALGDLGLGARAAIWGAGPAQLGARVDLLFPTSSEGAWAGERALRVAPGVLAGIEQGPLSARVDLGLNLRTAVATTADFSVGPEAALGGGVRLRLGDWVAPWVGATSRLPLDSKNFGEGGGVLEGLAGVQVFPARSLVVDALVGKGLTDGYGTSKLRAGLQVTWSHTPPDEPEVETVVEVKPPPKPERLLEDIPEETEIEGVGEVVFEPNAPPPPAARIVAQEIVIRDPIQFGRGTDRILPESDSTLAAIAKVMAEHPEVLQLVIEGHASDEGTYNYNYELSVKRALAVFRALVEAGVHPDRLSCRGVGEVAPAAAGETESALATNRRVIFRIARQWVPGEPFPGWSDTVRLPWTGETARVQPPPEGFGAPPPPPPQPIPETPDAGTFDEGDDE